MAVEVSTKSLQKLIDYWSSIFFFLFFFREKGIHIKVANSAGSTESSIKQESEKEI